MSTFISRPSRGRVRWVQLGLCEEQVVLQATISRLSLVLPGMGWNVKGLPWQATRHGFRRGPIEPASEFWLQREAKSQAEIHFVGPLFMVVVGKHFLHFCLLWFIG